MKLKRAEKRVLGWIGALAYLTGAVLFVLARWIRVASPVGEQHHPLEHPIRVSHTAVTYLVVLAVGYLVKGHILPGLRSRSKKQFLSGLGTLVLFAILTLSALIILYAGEGSIGAVSSWVHSGLGLASVAAVLFHAQKRHR